MRLTPAQRLMQRRHATVAAGGSPRARGGAQQAATTAYRLQLAELGDCLRQLKQIQAREAKIARKRELIATFDPWVAGILDAHRSGAAPVQDDIVLTMMVWSLDIEDHDRALPLIGYVLENDLDMPERYTRTAPTVIAEIAADSAIARIGLGEIPDLGFLTLVEEMTSEKDMIDEVRAKLHKSIGLTLTAIAAAPADEADAEAENRAGGRRAALAAAVPHLKRALHLHSKAGVKKELDKAERQLAKESSPPE
ncbi:MAG: terminase [Alphaproteobacteria bacterium HGW-Alphaproteobacteria-16]|nr:MAG: terminase [Alphaproteobacteria bacterium HGW-Alphaproteobacteria-16]